MADKQLEWAGFMRVWPEVLAGVYGDGIALASQIAGEELLADRLRFETKPSDADSVLEILQDVAVATGNGVVSNLKGYNGLAVRVVISATATVTFEVTIDDTNYDAVGLAAVATGTVATTATTTGLFYLPAMIRASQFRARISAFTSGTISVLARKHPR